MAERNGAKTCSNSINYYRSQKVSLLARGPMRLRLMSALGQKQTFAVQNGMSALPPIADINSHPTTSELIPFSKMRLGARCRSPLGILLQMSPRP